jgi:hypothetical protein
MKKNLFYSFLASYNFVSLKNDVNVPKGINRKLKKIFFGGVMKVTDEKIRVRSRIG